MPISHNAYLWHRVVDYSTRYMKAVLRKAILQMVLRLKVSLR